jgi:putative heme iron utilization protein
MPRDHQRPVSEPEGAGGAAPDAPPAARAPAHAERCRTLVSRARSAALSTIARDPAGFPYGSLVTVAVDGGGRPILLLSELAEHTQNLAHREDASILMTEPIDPSRSPLAVGRVTLLGPCRRVAEGEREAARAVFLAAQPDAAYYADFKDFAFYRLEPTALRYVGGFGRMSWVSADDYRAAEPDPLAADAAGILAHMNGDHASAVLAYARGLGRMIDATAATMTAVDRYGFEMQVSTPAGPRALRLGFDAPVATSDEVRRAMIAMVAAARAALGAGGGS